MPDEEDTHYSVNTASAGTISAGAASGGTVSAGAASAGSLSARRFALSALAVGAFALGAAAVGALAIGRLFIGKSHIKTLEIDELIVRRLTLGPGIDNRAAPIDDKAAVKELMAQFDQVDDRIKCTHAETAQLRAETRTILTEIQSFISTSEANADRTEETPEQEHTA